jgi:aryl-alcohol dehydrogenase-like predicted oxidoreductase
LSKNKNIIVSSKSYDYTYDGMKESVHEALEELGIRKIGIFMLHEQESKLTLKGHSDALQYLVDAKKMGLIQAVGVSTHAVEVVNAVCSMGEIDVIHPIVNKNGLGIMDGSIDEMLAAIQNANKCGKGIYAMKPLGGGNLVSSYEECLNFVLKNEYIHSIALGMQTKDEVEANVLRFEGKTISEELKSKVANRSKKLHIDSWCSGCGECVRSCKSKALSINGGKSEVNKDKCVLCGYCSAHCPDFCIKII